MLSDAAPRRTCYKTSMSRLLLVVAVLLAGIATAPPPAVATFFFSQPPFLDFGPIEDQLEIVVRARELLAVNAFTGGVVSADLERGENVLWTGVRGRVALVVTDRRALGTVPGQSHWAERAFELRESEPQGIVIGERVAMIVTDRRVLGFEGVNGSWSEAFLQRREPVLSVQAGTNVAVAVTRNRVLGEAAAGGGIFQAGLELRENVQAVHAHGSLATVTTALRLLTFRAPEGDWQATDLRFR
jgi:hypothetical protein